MCCRFRLVSVSRPGIVAGFQPALKLSLNRPGQDLSRPGCHGGCNNFFLSWQRTSCEHVIQKEGRGAGGTAGENARASEVRSGIREDFMKSKFFGHALDEATTKTKKQHVIQYISYWRCGRVLRKFCGIVPLTAQDAR